VPPHQRGKGKVIPSGHILAEAAALAADQAAKFEALAIEDSAGRPPRRQRRRRGPFSPSSVTLAELSSSPLERFSPRQFLQSAPGYSGVGKIQVVNRVQPGQLLQSGVRDGGVIEG
jgi:hypothetical protein